MRWREKAAAQRTRSVRARQVFHRIRESTLTRLVSAEGAVIEQHETSRGESGVEPGGAGCSHATDRGVR